MNQDESNDLVSICIPVYNGDEYIDACMEMILGQTYTNLEILLINDGSSDNTESHMKKYLYDPRVRIFKQSNMGPSAARNKAIKHAKGKYIFFCDIDDRIHRDAIGILHENAKSGELDLVIANTMWIKPNGSCVITKNIFRRSFYKGKDEVKKLILEYCNDIKAHRNLWTVWNKLYQTEIIKKNKVFFDETTMAEEDIIFVLDYLFCCERVGMIEDVLYVYNHGKSNGISSRGVEEPFAYKKVMEAFKKSISDERKMELANCYSELAIWSIFKQMQKYYCCMDDNEREKYYKNIEAIVNDSDLQQSILFYVQKHNDNDIHIPNFIQKKDIEAIIRSFYKQICTSR